MNEMSEAVKSSRAAKSSKMTKGSGGAELSVVQISVDESSRRLTLVPAEIMVHSGQIAFQIVSAGWQFAGDGITFTNRGDGTIVPDGLFEQIEKTDQRIVFQDRYDADNESTYGDAGRFMYVAVVENVHVMRLPDFETMSHVQAIIEIDAFNTSGAVVNQ
jgi:hypothetical protein